MDLRTKDGQNIFIAVERNWQGEQVSWAKRKCKAEAELHSSHIVTWLVKSHGDGVAAKLDPEIQTSAQKVVWRDKVPLHPKEIEIEDASEMRIDWLIDIKELETTTDDDKSIATGDVSISSFGTQAFFSSTQSQSQDTSKQLDENQPSALSEQEDSISNTTVAFTQGSQSVEGYDMPLALS